MAQEIKNIVFDLGGVLLTNDSIGLAQENEETQDLLNVSDIRLGISWLINWHAFRTGKISEDEFFDKFIKGVGREPTKELREEIKAIYREKVKALPLYNLLSLLPPEYTLLALTNISKEWLEFKADKFQLDQIFMGIIASCDERTAKPLFLIYLRLLKKHNLKANETLFIDDSRLNIFMAKLLGFKTIKVSKKDKYGEQVIDQLKDHNINLNFPGEAA